MRGVKGFNCVAFCCAGLILARQRTMLKCSMFSRLAAGLPLIALLAGACKRGGDDAAVRPDSVAGAPARPAAPFTEPQAVQILRTIDQARLSGAQAVATKSRSESVLEYAHVISSDHRAMTALLDSLLAATGQTPADHALVRQFATAATTFATELAARDTGVNNSYLAQEVRDHERALQLLQGGLIPSARSPQIRTLFQQLVPAYHAHLQRAQEILSQRTTTAASPSASTPDQPGPELRGTPVTPRPRARPRPDSGPRLLGRPVDTLRTTTTNM
jgi:putative membrane protein